MKSFYIYLAIALFAIGCGTSSNTTEKAQTAAKEVNYSSHGETITADEALPVMKVSEMITRSGDLDKVKFQGDVTSVCKKKGCWMKMQLADGEEMRVTFKDYGFFVPLDSDGKSAIVEGRAFYDTIPVEDLVHYAVDGGMSEEEAMKKYTEPELAINFEATGVLIEDKGTENKE